MPHVPRALHVLRALHYVLCHPLQNSNNDNDRSKPKQQQKKTNVKLPCTFMVSQLLEPTAPRPPPTPSLTWLLEYSQISHNCANAFLSFILKKRTMLTTARMSSENVGSRFCNHFWIVPSRLASKMCFNYHGIKLV